jgi:hypothetical protein
MTDVSEPWVARALENNGAEFLLSLGRAAGGRERDDRGKEEPPVSGGILQADEGTRTLDLLHGKDGARVNRNRHEQTTA